MIESRSWLSRYCQTLQSSGKIIYLLLLHYYLLDLHNKIKLLSASLDSVHLSDTTSNKYFHLFYSIYSLFELYSMAQFSLLITAANRTFSSTLNSPLLYYNQDCWSQETGSEEITSYCRFCFFFFF